MLSNATKINMRREKEEKRTFDFIILRGAKKMGGRESGCSAQFSSMLMIRVNCFSCRNRIAASECGLDTAAVCTGAMRIELSDGIFAEAHGRSVGRRRTLPQRSRLFGETQRQPLDGQNSCHVLRQHVAHRWQIDHLLQRGKKKMSFFFFFSQCRRLVG